jgi:hypothetical protein
MENPQVSSRGAAQQASRLAERLRTEGWRRERADTVGGLITKSSGDLNWQRLDKFTGEEGAQETGNRVRGRRNSVWG